MQRNNYVIILPLMAIATVHLRTVKCLASMSVVLGLHYSHILCLPFINYMQTLHNNYNMSLYRGCICIDLGIPHHMHVKQIPVIHSSE